MVGLYDRNPYDEEDVNPFSDPAFRKQRGNNSIAIPMGEAIEMKQKGQELHWKEEELKKREHELNRREADLIRREEAVARAGLGGKNWPPLIPFKIIHHDIKGEIPLHLQPLQTYAYICWLGLLVALIWNFIAVSGAFTIVHPKATYGVQIWLLAIIYVFSGFPMSYNFWYKPLYSAMKTGSKLKFGRFFFFFLFHILFNIFAAIAPPIAFKGASLAGILPALEIFFADYTGIAVLYFIGFGFFTMEACFSIWVLLRFYRYFRGVGPEAGGA